MGRSAYRTNDKKDSKDSLWTTHSLKNGVSSSSSDKSIEVSNSSVVFPVGLDVHHNFITEEEVDNLLKQVDKERHIWEGFEQRRRVWNFSVLPVEEEGRLKDGENNSSRGSGRKNENNILPSSLRLLTDRIIEQIGYTPQKVSVEEYPPNQLSRNLTMSQYTVTKFESTTLCRCSNQCRCFVATLPLRTSVVEHLNRPRKRHVSCWDLHSPNHWTGLLMNERSLMVKTDECLWHWRSRIAATASDVQDEDRIVLVKFYSLPDASDDPTAEEAAAVDCSFGYIAKPENTIPRSETMPPLEQVLTVIVTTSPIKSNPSTELLERTFATFRQGGPTFAYKCRKVIVCDGCRQRDETVTKRHNNVKQAMRNGIVTGDQWEHYLEFKRSLRKLCTAATLNSTFWNTHIEELDSRHGYGFALRHALQNCITTPFVIVVQHDRTFMRPTPIQETVQTMWNHQKIKYVGMSQRSNLMYRDMFLGKYGRAYMDEMSESVLRPKELALDSELYGPDSFSTRNMDYSGQQMTPKLRRNIDTLAETYQASQQNIDHQEWLKLHPPAEPDKTCQLSLTPTFFWYDNIHICETAHYRDFVFNPLYKMAVKGGFVEETISPVIKKAVECFGLKQGHARFGCYLLDDHSGMFFTGHLDGGCYIPTEERKALIAASKKAGREKVLREQCRACV